ncbi:MAG: hypothetical protein ACR2N3_17305 [Pyrinomonadaceae bacterium]
MRKLLFLLGLIVSFGVINSTVWAQSPKPSVLTGEVTNIADGKIVLQTKDGAVDVQLSGATEYKRVLPENPNPKAAVASSLAEVGAGDKIAVTGILSDDKKSIPAKSVYIMTKADITKRNETDREAWKTRGISGRIVSIDAEKQDFTIASRGMAGEQSIVVSPKLNITYRRYAPDSVKFDDAKTSSFAELKVGDQVRALGDKGADGMTFRAERVVAGSFKTIGGTITAIDAAKNEITIKDIQTNKPVTITVNDNSILKKFPAEFAQMMAMRGQGGGGTQPPTGANGQSVSNSTTRPPQQPSGQGNSQGQTPPNGMREGGGMRGARGAFDDLLDRFPTIALADLKVGDAIAISSTTGADASRATAIKLVSGVEPFFKARQMGGGGRRRGNGGTDSGFTIPGLDDGIGTP